MPGAIDSLQVKEWGRELGFSLVGIGPAGPVEEGDFLRDYLGRGYQGGMSYLGRDVEKRIDASRLVEGGRSVICGAINYFNELNCPQNDTEKYGKVGRYAWGLDYHGVVKEKLKQLAGRIKKAAGGEIILRCFGDTAPLLEKAHGARAGLGWIGKNGLLINEQYGSWLVLGEIVTDWVFDYDEPVADKCGECERCLEACPSRALVGPRILDARRCISYLTVESREEIPHELKGKTGDWLFGCDICQEVCPFNQKAVCTGDEAFGFRSQWSKVQLAEILSMDKEQFDKRFAGSSIVRTNLEHLRHVAGNCVVNIEGSS